MALPAKSRTGRINSEIMYARFSTATASADVSHVTTARESKFDLSEKLGIDFAPDGKNKNLPSLVIVVENLVCIISLIKNTVKKRGILREKLMVMISTQGVIACP